MNLKQEKYQKLNHEDNVIYAQLVIGPPGAGKTTYCSGMSAFLKASGRPCSVINLDPANEQVDGKYDCAIDISELCSLEEVMEHFKLGPNGGLVYCMEFLEKNLDWLKEKLAHLSERYLIFDCPGQVELFTHHGSLKNIVRTLGKWGFRLTCVHLVDAYYCADPATYISASLLSLSTMLQLELPHINVLSKIDLLEKYDKLAFQLDFYKSAFDLDLLVPYIGLGRKEKKFLDETNDVKNNLVIPKQEVEEQEPKESEEGRDHNDVNGDNNNDTRLLSNWTKKYRKLNEMMVELVHDFRLVEFQSLNVMDPESMQNVINVIDRSNGYVRTADERKFAETGQSTYIEELAQAHGSFWEGGDVND